MRLTKPPVKEIQLPAELEPYLKRLNSRHKQHREEALEAARQLPLDQFLALATAATQRIPGLRLRYQPFGAMVLLVLLLFVMLAFPASWPFSVPLLTVVTLPALVLCCAPALEKARLYMALRTLMAERGDVCLLGAALELQIWGDCTIRPATMPWQKPAPAIERMVRQMTPDDYADLTVPQKQRLLSWLLDPPDNVSFCLTLMESLKPICDKNAMERVAQVVRMRAVTPVQKRIREAAQECLAAMQREQRKEEQTRVLLRASGVGQSVAPPILLRPASGPTLASAPDQLLRASDFEAQNLS